jgi:spermidine/putrescine transport system ATP-binding protein
MQYELKQLQKQLGITFIYITHDQEEALTMSDRIAVMRNGLFEQTGSAEEVYSRPATSYVARFVGNANVLKSEEGCLAVRAEHVEFVPFDEAALREPVVYEPKVRGLPARITARVFTGGQVRLTAVLRNGEEITACRQGIEPSLQNGTEVLARWAPENAVPVEDTE